MAIVSTLWQNPDTSGWVNPRDYVGLYGSTNPVGYNPDKPTYDPERLAADVSQYYGTAVSSLPTFPVIARNIKGVVSPEVRRQIGQAAAERGVGIGSYGGGNDATAFLRALGLTAMDLENRGVDQYQKSMSTVPALPPTSLFVTPAQQSQQALQWAVNQADINSRMQLARMNEAGATTRARMGQASSYYATNAQLAARQAEADRQAAINAATSGAIQSGLASLSARIGAGQDAWYDGDWVPGGNVTSPSNRSQGAAYSALGYPSTGGTYMGPALPGLEAEYDVLSGQASPADYGVTPGVYAPGEAQNPMDYFYPYSDYYLGL